jgi:hypothetical protein
LPSFRDAGEHL